MRKSPGQSKGAVDVQSLPEGNQEVFKGGRWRLKSYQRRAGQPLSRWRVMRSDECARNELEF